MPLARPLLWLLLAQILRWALLAACGQLPGADAGDYDALGSIGDVVALGTVSGLLAPALLLATSGLSRCPPWLPRLARAAQLLPSCCLLLCGIKALCRLLEPPPEATHALGREAFTVATALLGLSFALERHQLAALRRGLLARSLGAGRAGRDVELVLVEAGAAGRAGHDGEEERPSPAPGETRRHVRRLLGLAGEHGSWVAWGCLALLVRLPFSIAIPHFVSEGIGAAIDHGSADPAVRAGAGARVRGAVVGLLVCGTLDSILDFFNFQLFVVVKQKVIKSLKLRLFGNMLSQELAFFDSQATGELMSRLTADTVEMSADISFVFRFSIEAVVRVSGVAGYMFFASWRLALLTCTIIPVNAQLNKVYADWLHDNAKRSQSALAESNACAEEAFSGIMTVKAFAKEEFQLGRYAQSVQRYYELGLLQGVVTSTYYMVVSTFLMNCVVQAALVGYGALLCWRGAMAVESLVAFMLYRSQLQEWVNKILDSYTQLVRGAGAADRVFGLLDRRPELRSGAALPADRAKGRVEFEQVHFAYASRPEAPVLRGLSLSALPGQCVAVVGSSGSGKTTLFRLLLHLYEPLGGRVLLDGEDVCELLPRELCARVGLVGQEPTLFQGSVEDNIRYALAEPGPAPSAGGWRHWWRVWRGEEEEVGGQRGAGAGVGAAWEGVEEAARIANAHDFIMKLPRGYGTEVGERGVQLSGGQRQRVAIARAVLQRPSVLLLDEATSALDSESERLVQEALDRAMMEQTTLVIAHRLTTVTKADKIAVLEAGRLAEQGTHEELLQACGRYRELWHCQRDLAGQ